MINANLPWVESPFFEELFSNKDLTDQQRNIARKYHDDGFVVIPGLLPESLIDDVKKDVQERAFNPAFPLKTPRDKTRVQDFWKVSTPSKDLACFGPLLDILEMLYDRKPIPFQTLNFSVGSQQRAHSDTIHFSSLPAKYMCGVWVALEDINEENGPVFYYPGSQRLPEYDFSHIRTSAKKTSYDNYKEYEDFIGKIVEVHSLQKKTFTAKKGDLLIWSSNIIHGGSPVLKEGATRWSQVTHYFFEDCYYYTPMLSNMATKELFMRNRLRSVITGKRIKQSYNGAKLSFVKTKPKLYVAGNSFPNPLFYMMSLINNIFE